MSRHSHSYLLSGRRWAVFEKDNTYYISTYIDSPYQSKQLSDFFFASDKEEACKIGDATLERILKKRIAKRMEKDKIKDEEEDKQNGIDES